MTPFTFVLDWHLNCQFAGLIWARDKGLYAAADLDVTLVDGWSYERPTLEMVLAEEVGAGCMECNLVVRANLAGRGVKAIGAMLQDTPMVLMTPADSGIQTLHDLPGKHIGMHRDGIHLLRTVLTLHGIDPDTVKADVEGWSLADLVAGSYDAIQGYTITEPAQLRQLGLDPYLIPVRHHNLHPYAQMMFATTRCIEQNETVLGRFMTATFDGWRAALAHPAETAQLVANVSTNQPDPVTNQAIIEAMVPLATGDVGMGRLGHLDVERWARNLKTYADFGMVERVATPAELLDTRFVPL